MDLMNLSTKKAAEAGFDVRLTNPFDGTDLPIVIRVLGTDSDTYRKLLRRQNERRTERLARAGRRAMPKEEELLAETIDRVVACTVAWKVDEGKTVTLGGKPLPAFSSEAARELYTNEDLGWVLEQVDAAMSNRANFSPGSAKS